MSVKQKKFYYKAISTKVLYIMFWSLFILINTQREQLLIICNFSLPLLKLLKHIIILHKNIAVAQHKTLKK